MDHHAEPAYIPSVNRGTAVAVWLDQQQIPYGIERIDFEFIVLMGVPVGIDKDFKVVIVKNDRFPFRECRPNLILFELRREIETLVVP